MGSRRGRFFCPSGTYTGELLPPPPWSSVGSWCLRALGEGRTEEEWIGKGGEQAVEVPELDCDAVWAVLVDQQYLEEEQHAGTDGHAHEKGQWGQQES